MHYQNITMDILIKLTDSIDIDAYVMNLVFLWAETHSPEFMHKMWYDVFAFLSFYLTLCILEINTY